MTYISCPNCGHKALNIATRCPQCGHAFEGRLWQSPASVTRGLRIPRSLIAAVVLIGLVVVGVVQRGRRGPAVTPLPPPPARLTDTLPRPAPPVPATQPVDSMSRVDSMSPIDSAPPAADSAIAPAPAPPVAGPADLRYASTWVNLRASRNGTAPVLGILGPGDSIRVDSLLQGWYRVRVDGQVRGYVDWNYLAPTPEPVRP